MIPKEDYVDIQYVGYCITMAQVRKYHTEQEYDNFCKWLTGQTYTCMPDGKTPAIYSWDYERWTRQGRHTEQGKDWD